jgi:hypothetical protein
MEKKRKRGENIEEDAVSECDERELHTSLD